MTDQTAENETNENQFQSLANEADPHSMPEGGDEGDIVEGEIVAGTWINPNVPTDDPRRSRPAVEFESSYPARRPSFLRMIFGSVVIFTEEVADRSTAYDEDTPQEAIEALIRQAASQERSIDDKPFANLRYGTIGLLSGVLNSAQDGAGRLTGMTNAAARTAAMIMGPIWNSFLFEPLHQPAQRAEQAGEQKVDEWIRRGRVEEVRSRALAEVSINNLVEESVTDLTQNTQVQLLVQEVIASQSTSLATEMLEEARERLVSLDILLMGKLNRNLAPAPDFRESYLKSLTGRRPSYQRMALSNSLAGTYAGPVTRLVALLLDVLVLIIALGLLSSFVSSAINLFGLTELVNEFLLSGGLVSTLLVFLLASFNILLLSSYFVFSWNWIGATLGDLVFGLRVVNKEGERVSFWRSILRLIGGYISAVLFFLGFIWALFDGRRQGWHDKIGATFVLYDWPAKPDENFLRHEVMAELNEENA